MKLAGMEIEKIIAEIKSLKPSIEEVSSSYKEADEDYWNYLLDNFNVNYDLQCNTFSNLIDDLISCTDLDKVDFGGIRFNNEITSLQVENLALKSIASFQENRLAVNTTYDEFFYIDFYDPNDEPIIVREKFNGVNFISAMLYLLELDTNFKFKNQKIDKDALDKLSNLAGGTGYKKFFEIVLSQYE
ncbi:hypothetical protein I5M27_14710 [Adhaeribacter sp. BT258]|uniref:Uncharacterized protein n=1 Tax=Adhaeribacter terrigena TaxID=2793070 RepID=A0ABS1C4B3_9BACT|nr:hypothetical protein [Adhaeribacter terrigena]MBK0404245.1 hypothetical protein [Adhaeribacter terrigena]